MPAMKRPSKKAQKIAESILGKPHNVDAKKHRIRKKKEDLYIR